MNSKAKIVIAGCGYIGKLLAQQLLKSGYTVTGLVRSKVSQDECTQLGISSQQMDFDDLAMMQEKKLSLTGKRIIYLAPPPKSGQQDSRIKNFLQSIADQHPEKFVLISTTGVYGNCHGDWVDEATPVNPVADRALRRLDAERQCQAWCKDHNVPLVILRVPGIYGPGKLPLERIKKAVPVVRQEDSPFTNRIHAFDLVNICETALFNEQIKGIYNCSDGQPGTMYDYFMQVAAANDLPAPPAISLEEAKRQLSQGMLSYMAESRRINNDKLLQDFHIELQYLDLHSGLRAGIKG